MTQTAGGRSLEHRFRKPRILYTDTPCIESDVLIHRKGKSRCWFRHIWVCGMKHIHQIPQIGRIQCQAGLLDFAHIALWSF